MGNQVMIKNRLDNIPFLCDTANNIMMSQLAGNERVDWDKGQM